MSKLNAGIGSAMYSIKKWTGVNESPDGDTNLRDGEGAAMRNFRITDGGALRKRPGSKTVAGLLSAYSIAVGEEEQYKVSSGNAFRKIMYPSVTLNDKGEYVFRGEAKHLDAINYESLINYYFAGDGANEAWQLSRVVANLYEHGEYVEVGCNVDVDIFNEHNVLTLRLQPNAYYPTELTVATKLELVDGELRLYDPVLANLDGPLTIMDVHDNPDKYWWQDENGDIYRLVKFNDIYVNPYGFYGFDAIGYKVRDFYTHYYTWYARRLYNTPNVFDTAVKGLWGGYVNNTEYIVAACNGHLWMLTETAGDWNKTDMGNIDTSDHVCLFGFDNKLYCLDGKEYYVWDGENLTTVSGYIPLIGVGSSPAGATTTLERINILTPRRRQRFSADGTSTVYKLAEKDLASIDRVEIDGELFTIYDVNVKAGTVTFRDAPMSGADNVEIWYTAQESYRSKAAAMRYAEFYNGANDSRVFLYGDGSNITIYSDVRYDTGRASAEYFPDLNEIAVGDANTPLTSLIRQYSRLMAFKSGGSAWSIYYDTMTLADGSVTAGFYCNGVNRSIGNDALGQVVLVENKPRTLDGRSIYEWQSSSGGYITNDQRNAKRISQKVENTLLDFNFADCVMYYDKINHEFYCVYDSTAVVQNVENEAWYIYTDFPALAMISYKDELYFGTDSGELRKFSDEYTDDSGAAIDCYWESGSMSFGRDYVQKYSPSVWVGLKQEDNAGITVGIETDRSEIITADIALADDIDAMPRMNRCRLKAQKFTYYKLIFSSLSVEQRATVVAADIKVKYNINVK